MNALEATVICDSDLELRVFHGAKTFRSFDKDSLRKEIQNLLAHGNFWNRYVCL